MAQPSAPYTAAALQRATDANFSAGDESGLSTKLEPSAGQKAQGHVSGLAAPASWQNYWEHGVGLWLSYLASLDSDAYFLGRPYTWTAAHVFAGGATFQTAGVTLTSNLTGAGGIDISGAVESSRFLIDHASNEWDYKTPRTRTKTYEFGGYGDGVGFVDYTTAAAGTSFVGLKLAHDPATTSNQAHWRERILLPQGAVITGWQVLLLNNANSAGATNARVALYKRTPTISTLSPAVGSEVQIGSNQNASGANTLQVVGESGLSETVVDGTVYYLYVYTPTSGGSAVVEHMLYNYEITFTDPGPRNY